MTLQFTPQGVEINTLDEEFEAVAEAYRAIYGQDINLDQDSPDGQRVGIEAKARVDVQTFGLQLYNSFDPDLASGLRLTSIGKLAGANRRPATRSTLDVEVTTNRPLTLPQNYVIEDPLGQQWQTPESVSLPTGVTTVTFQAVTFGPVELDADTTLSQATVVLGVTSLYAPGAATVGVAEETDPEYRRRRNKSLQNAAYSTTGGLFAKLATTPGVLDVQVYENDTDVYDPVQDLDAHHIWAVVDGGTVADIVETMAKNKTSGTGMKGDVVGVYEELRIRPNGAQFVVPHTMRFDRPTPIDVYITLTATRKNAADPIDITLIKQLLAAETFGIGDDVIASELYEVAYEAGSNFFLTDLLISDDNITFTDERLTGALQGKYVIDTANITVTEITPP